jgi:hypothetical protein
VRRIELAPGEVPTPAHVHVDDEEIFFVLAGSGLSWQKGETHEIRAGDCLVHRARGAPHTLRAGSEGLDVLAFGPRSRPGSTFLPNQHTAWLGPHWIEGVAAGEHPYAREPVLAWAEPSPRPPSTVNLDELEGDYGGRYKRLAREAGAERSGLNWATLEDGEEGRTRFAPATLSRARPGRASHTPSAAARPASPTSSTARRSRTTSAGTRARTRSSSAGWG